jgi:F-type H+-transporting ATPase subunit epsilon
MAEDSLFQINLVTPERILLTGMASEAVLRTAEGDVTFLANHTPLVGSVEAGVVRVIRPDEDDLRVAVHGGFVQVEQGVVLEGGDTDGQTTGSRVTLLLGVAELADEVDVEAARADLEAAESKVAELTGAGRPAGETDESDPALAEAEADAAWARARIDAVDATATAG